MSTNHSILGVPSDSTPERTRKVYLALSKIYHPDNLETGDAAHFGRVSAAYNAIAGVPQDKEGDPEVIQFIVQSFRNVILGRASMDIGGDLKDALTREIEGHKTKAMTFKGQNDKVIKSYRDALDGMSEEADQSSLRVALEFDLRTIEEQADKSAKIINVMDRAISTLEGVSFKGDGGLDFTFLLGGMGLEDVLKNGGKGE